MGWNSAEAQGRANGGLICTKESVIWARLHETMIRGAFGAELTEVVPSALGHGVNDLSSNLYLKSFLEQGIGKGLRRGQPLVLRSDRSGSTLIVDRHASKNPDLDGLRSAIGGSLHGRVTVRMDNPNTRSPNAGAGLLGRVRSPRSPTDRRTELACPQPRCLDLAQAGSPRRDRLSGPPPRWAFQPQGLQSPVSLDPRCFCPAGGGC